MWHHCSSIWKFIPWVISTRYKGKQVLKKLSVVLSIYGCSYSKVRGPESCSGPKHEDPRIQIRLQHHPETVLSPESSCPGIGCLHSARSGWHRKMQVSESLSYQMFDRTKPSWWKVWVHFYLSYCVHVYLNVILE